MASSSNSNGGGKSFWTPARLALTCTVLLVLAAFGASSCNSSPPAGGGGASSSPRPGGPTVTVTSGKPTTTTATAKPSIASPVTLPAGLRQVTLTQLDGKTLKLEDYEGKVVVLNFWATWCGPCRAEMPDLIRLYDEYKDKGVEVIGVSSKQNDPNLDAVKSFVRQMNVNYKVVYEEGNFAAPLLQSINARGVIPQSVVLSRTGQVIEHMQGFNAALTPSRLRDVINQALKS